jgi:heparin binding hemagglutinin HbhA
MATSTKSARKSGDVVTVALEQARIPLLALVGAGDYAAKSVVDALQRVRKQVNERAEAARSTVDDLPGEISGLRGRFEPNELRKVVDSYTSSAVQAYHNLASHGEETLDKLRTQPQVKKALEQAEVARQRAESYAGDARELADDMLGRVTRRTRSVGERTARATERAGDQAAEKVSEAGQQAASTTRSTAQKTAAKTTSARRATSGGSTSATRKTTK